MLASMNNETCCLSEGFIAVGADEGALVRVNAAVSGETAGLCEAFPAVGADEWALASVCEAMLVQSA